MDSHDILNLADYFLTARMREGLEQKVAIRHAGGDATYGDVERLTNRFGNLLMDLGVRPEERVIIALPDSLEWAAAFFGVLKIGAIVVMVNPDAPLDDARYFVSYTRPRALFTTSEHAEKFSSAASDLRAPAIVVAVDAPDTQDTLQQASADLDTVPTHRDEAAIWLFSGGTTGHPKAVMQSHGSFVNTTLLYAKGVVGYSRDDLTISVPKLYFGYATGSNLLFPFAAGGTVALFPERCTAEALLDNIARYKPSLLILVPTMINKLLSDAAAAKADLSCLRLATSAGEALPPELYRRWMDAYGVELLDGLGTAEMWHIFISNRPGRVRPGSLGQAVPGFEVKVCGDSGIELGRGETGWLWVRGQSRAIAYWQRMEETKRAFHGEWYVTGDLVAQDKDGFFHYAGRSDDMLKVSGKWVSPQEIENCLLEHPGVREAAVAGVADESGLIKPHAYVIPGEGGVITEEDLQAFVKSRLEPYKYPRRVVFLAEFPRTHLGKVDRTRLREAK